MARFRTKDEKMNIKIKDFLYDRVLEVGFLACATALLLIYPLILAMDKYSAWKAK